jgi:thiol-disulfide isomerase/thioredoxin
MKVICFTLFLLFLNLGNIAAQPIQFTNKISENKITPFNNQKLILIDFWATWCGPCVTATKQMEIFQEYNKDKVFIFSVSDETEKIVNKYLTKIPINLMVVLDKDKRYIDKYKVTSRPFAVLVNLKGQLLWKGHPGDLNQKVLNSYYEKTKNDANVTFDELVVFKDIVETPKQAFHQPVDFSIKKSPSTTDVLEIDENKVNYSGKIAKLISKIKDKTIFELEIENSLNYTVDLVCDIDDWNNKTVILNKICEKLNLNIEDYEKIQFGNEIIVDNKALLWKSTEIDWEDNPVKYLIGSDKITANDVSIKEIARIMSNCKNKNYIYLGDDTTLYDWDFQFLYDDLMKEDLASTFGISIKPTNAPQNITKVTSN